MYIEYNPNPVGSNVGDCVVRAVSKALNITWEEAYVRLCIMGFAMGDLPNNDNVFGAVLRMNGFKKRTLSDSCPDCYTVRQFAKDNPFGTYVLGLGNHVVAVEDGDIYDSFDSSNGIPIYFWYKYSDERMNSNEPNLYSESKLLDDKPSDIRSSTEPGNAKPADKSNDNSANAADKPAAAKPAAK